ncbi:MAG TPA: choice-of-anchor tandem repeat GloVer-containing protein [Candidatus Sulfotelmatobacter sp.]|nr:choice-of-anchor tandem repeat GloVer-containing protein [Candidatus Sulfotelmatobacter sp.]
MSRAFARPFPTILAVLRIAGAGSSRLPLACALLVFLVAAPLCAQTYQDLYDLDCPGGCTPWDRGRLTQGTDGNLYGTTEYGGTNGFGTIFRVNPSGAGYTVLWNFDGATTGANPIAALTLSSVDGNFYGATFDGGTYGDSLGTVFSFNPSTSTLTVLHHFDPSEDSPWVPPVEGKDKNLYGMTHSGATYRVTPPAGTFQLLANKVPGTPTGPFLLAADGTLYGTTGTGGTNFQGTIFRMTTAGVIQTLYSFTGNSDGGGPNAPLVQASDGTFYGTTSYDLQNFDGTVFKFTLKPFKLTTLHNFTGSDGANPDAGLLLATDGNLYGTTSSGGQGGNDFGTLFEITTGGVFTHLFDFTGDVVGVAGAQPRTTLMEDTNGILYGLTSTGGLNGVDAGGYGVFYSLTLPNVNTNITLCCNWWVILDQPVTILGQNLTGVFSVSFGGAAAQFTPGSDTYLTAYVPNGAVDGVATVTLATGQQLQSQQTVHILPKVTSLDPLSGSVGTVVNVSGGGFSGTKKVTFGGVAASNFTTLSPSLIQATVPTGAVTGKVVVTTPNGSANSKQTFTVH